MTSKQRIKAFIELGHILKSPDDQLNKLINSAQQYNAWFTPPSTSLAIKAIADMLNKKDLEQWMVAYSSLPSKLETNTQQMYSVGLILAGNIPMVGFHDILCVLASGNKALIKLSSQDQKLIPFILGKLLEIEPGFNQQFEYIERLKDFDAVIATGSNNTSRYFEYYFKSVPHIIRKNRNSIAVLSGQESPDELKALGHDIFDYFGLGCRNVSKLYVPKGYNFETLFESIEVFKPVSDHHKYNNNYDYNKSIFLVNMEKHLDNGFLLLKEDVRTASPLAVLYYEEYDNLAVLNKELMSKSEQIQCVISHIPLKMSTLEFGQSQQPGIMDYADGIDTMLFLKEVVRN